jgi:WD40 repeat protein
VIIASAAVGCRARTETVVIQNPPLVIKATELGMLPLQEGGKPPEARVPLLASRDGRRWAYATLSCVALDGKEGKHYEKVSGIEFSPDSRHFAYIARTGAEWFVVKDGNEIRAGGEVPAFAFSPDSSRFAYLVKSGGKFFAVIDGAKGAEYDDIVSMKGTASEQLKVFVFSPDCKHVAYVARTGWSFVMVLDGKAGNPYDKIETMLEAQSLFSPDSRHFFYPAISKGKRLVIVDGVESEGTRSIPYYSPDGKRVAYVIGGGENQPGCVEVDGVRGKEYTNINAPIFSPDSRHCAYRVGGILGGAFWVVDGVEQKHGGVSLKLTFSPDSQHYAYGIDKGIVLDGVERYVADAPGPPEVAFSPDSKHVGYAVNAKSGTSRRMVVDEVVGVGYLFMGHKGRNVFINTTVPPPTFSPDSQHYVYFGANPKPKTDADNTPPGVEYFLVIDGKEVKCSHDPYNEPVFDSPTKFHYIGTKADKVFLIEVEIGE